MVAWFSNALDRLFPGRCVSCGATGAWWCEACSRKVVVVERPGCPRCRRSSPNSEFCGRCRPDFVLAGVVAAAEHREPFTKLIKALKYRHAKAVTPELLNYLGPALQRHSHPGHVTLVPVPLHPKRLAERGHNQSELLAKALAKELGVSLSRGLTRTRPTESQTGLTREQRRKNVAKAFRWTGIIPDGTLVVVDDVVTTGATLNACAEACRDAGAGEIWGLAAGRR